MSGLQPCLLWSKSSSGSFIVMISVWFRHGFLWNGRLIRWKRRVFVFSGSHCCWVRPALAMWSRSNKLNVHSTHNAPGCNKQHVGRGRSCLFLSGYICKNQHTISFSAIKQWSAVCKLSGNEQALGVGCSKM